MPKQTAKNADTVILECNFCDKSVIKNLSDGEGENEQECQSPK